MYDIELLTVIKFLCSDMKLTTSQITNCNIISIVYCDGNSLNQTTIRGPMPNVMAALPSIGGALYKSSLIPFIVPCRKVWLTLTARCQYRRARALDAK